MPRRWEILPDGRREFLTRTEARHLARLDLDLLARLRVAADASLALGHRERAESDKGDAVPFLRSEEHTELQSPCNLVCRLLLEKKKHTSELQSPCNLVCRLLLEKKEHTSELQSPCNIVFRLLLEKKKIT